MSDILASGFALFVVLGSLAFLTYCAVAIYQSFPKRNRYRRKYRDALPEPHRACKRDYAA